MKINIGIDSIPTHVPCLWEHGISYDTPSEILEPHGISDRQVVILICLLYTSDAADDW